MSTSRPIEERFREKVDKTPGQGPNGDCWEWQAYRDRSGYGVIALGAGRRGKTNKAHRVAWELEDGPIPAEMDVRHAVCDNPPCVRKSHLALGSHRENMRDKVAKCHSGKGVRRTAHKLTPQSVGEIRAAYAKGGVSQRELGARYGLSRIMVGMVIRGQAWKDVA